MINRLIIALMWAVVALALILGVNCYADAQAKMPAPGTPEHYAAVIQADCSDLMAQVRQQYGRAPMCLTLPETGNTGMIGLTDNLQGVWFYMHFVDENPDEPSYHAHTYRYNTQEYQDVIDLIMSGAGGVTDNQMGNIAVQRFCDNDARMRPEMREKARRAGISEQDIQRTFRGMDETRKQQGCAPLSGAE